MSPTKKEKTFWTTLKEADGVSFGPRSNACFQWRCWKRTHWLLQRGEKVSLCKRRRCVDLLAQEKKEETFFLFAPYLEYRNVHFLEKEERRSLFRLSMYLIHMIVNADAKNSPFLKIETKNFNFILWPLHWKNTLKTIKRERWRMHRVLFLFPTNTGWGIKIKTHKYIRINRQ